MSPQLECELLRAEVWLVLLLVQGGRGCGPTRRWDALQGVRVGALAFLSHKLKLLAPSPGQELLAEAPGGYK